MLSSWKKTLDQFFLLVFNIFQVESKILSFKNLYLFFFMQIENYKYKHKKTTRTYVLTPSEMSNISSRITHNFNNTRIKPNVGKKLNDENIERAPCYSHIQRISRIDIKSQRIHSSEACTHRAPNCIVTLWSAPLATIIIHPPPSPSKSSISLAIR